jgi:hypothetical protein
MKSPSEHEREPAQAVIAPGETPVHRASPARAPHASAELVSAREEHAAYIQGREQMERAGVLRALLVLGVVVLVCSIWRAGLDRVFVHGWWKQW